MQTIPLHKRLHSFKMLCENIRKNGIPTEISTQAIQENTWFTAYYLQKSLEGILSWAEEIDPFLAAYEGLHSENLSPKKIGIIAAGNVPFVCMHDILMAIFSGNIAVVKFSHQDKVLPKWFCQEWIKILPNLAHFLHFLPSINNCDFLIATGSNNTANALDYQFSHIPKLIRKHRYSVAIIRNDINEENLTSICSDVLLYNGLGCRNVSHIFIPHFFSISRIEKALNEYPSMYLSENYLAKLTESKARLSVMKQAFISTKTALLQIQSDIEFSHLGIVNLIFYKDEKEVSEKLATLEAQIQCIVGKNIAFGDAQQPLLSDFADGEDTMALLLKLKQ